MALLNTDTKKLSKDIESFGKTRAENNYKLHELACNATALASRDGRVEWLNELFSKLEVIAKDAFKAWLSPFADTFDTPEMKAWMAKNPDENKRPKWIKFNTREQKFEIIPSTVSNRPPLVIIEQVLADYENKFMLNKRASAVAQTIAWDLGLIKRLEQMEKLILKTVEDHSGNPVVRQRLEIAAKRAHEFVVDATPLIKDLSKLEAPLQEGPNSPPEKPADKPEPASVIKAEKPAKPATKKEKEEAKAAHNPLRRAGVAA